MTFFLSKFLWPFFHPVNMLVYLVILGWLAKWLKLPRVANFMIIVAFFVFGIAGVLPTGSYLVYLLEKDYQPLVVLPEHIDGILILAGATVPSLTKKYGQISLNDNVERLTESVEIMKKYPEAKVGFAGGSGSLTPSALTHADVAQQFYERLGVETRRIYFENQSRNTYENILFSQRWFHPENDEKWLLITSAYHMKRAIKIGEKLGWHFIPYATDYRSYHNKEFRWHLTTHNFAGNLSAFGWASHEWAGMLAYFLMGRL